ncbi:hypothetical protein [Massilia psychrophila]|jgi:hypothetical protein|nr:hypothetical protein [Massilia psychrophila]
MGGKKRIAYCLIYESNWRFVDPEQLNDQERHLIDELIETCGHGLMNL